MCTPPRGLRGWGCPRRAAGPSVPLSADTVFPPPASVAVGGGALPVGRREGGIRARAEAPGLRGWRLPLRELPRAASGLWVVLALGVSGVGDGLVPRGGGGGPRGWCGVVWGRVFGPPSFTVLPLAGGASRRPAGPAAPPCLCGAFLPRRASAVRARSPPHPPWLSPCRDGRLAPEAESVGASAPRGRVPRRRPAGRRGVCPPLRALPPGCGRAAVRAPAARGRGLWRRWGREGIREGVARCVRRPSGLRRLRVPQPPPPALPPVHPSGAPAPSVP